MPRQSINPAIGERTSALYQSEWSKGPIQPRLALRMHLGDTVRGPLDHGCRTDLCATELHHG